MGPDSGRPRGFTLIEVMVAVVLIGIVSTAVTVRIDLFGTDSSNELEHLLTFVRTQHARSLQQSRTVFIRVDGNEGTVTAEHPDGQAIDAITLSRWEVVGSSDVSLRLTPWGVHGGSIRLESNQREINLVPNSTRTITVES